MASDEQVRTTLVVLDERRRVALGRVGRHRRYLVTEHADGTLIFEPAVVVSEHEARFLARPDLLAKMEAPRVVGG